MKRGEHAFRNDFRRAHVFERIFHLPPHARLEEGESRSRLFAALKQRQSLRRQPWTRTGTKCTVMRMGQKFAASSTSCKDLGGKPDF